MTGFMDKTTIFIAGMVIVLYYFSFHQTGEFPWAATHRAGGYVLEIIPKILLGFLIGAILPDILPKEIVESWLSARSGWKGILIGWIVGGTIPMGAPFVLFPMAIGLMKGGAGIGPIVTMLTSSALMGPFRIVIYEIPIMGWEFLAARMISVFWMPPVAGYLAQIAGTYIK